MNPIICIIVALASFFGILYYVARKNEQNKKKDGNIFPEFTRTQIAGDQKLIIPILAKDFKNNIYNSDDCPLARGIKRALNPSYVSMDWLCARFDGYEYVITKSNGEKGYTGYDFTQDYDKASNLSENELIRTIILIKR